MSSLQDKITLSVPAPRQDRPEGGPRPDPVLRVEFTLTLENMAAFLRYHRREGHRPEGKPPGAAGAWVEADREKEGEGGKPPGAAGAWLWLLLLVILVAVLLGTGGWPKWSELLPDLAYLVGPSAVVIGIFVLALFGGKLRDRLVVRKLSRTPLFFEKRTLQISPAGLAAADPSGALTLRWHAVPRIREDEGQAYFYTSPTDAFILPRRAFADERQFGEFVDAARRYHAEARRLVRTEGQP